MTDLAALAWIWPIAREVLHFIWGVLPVPITDALIWQFIYLPVLLALVYPIAIQYERGGWWRLLYPVTALALLVDVWLNWTTFSLYLWSAPGKREYTLSQHLERLVFDRGWRGFLARGVARYTNRWDPSPPHIPLP